MYIAHFDHIWLKNYYKKHYLMILVIFCKNLTIWNKKNFGQKNVVLAHSGVCDMAMAETSLYSIFRHL
jgi:hypothetical protein